LRFDRAPLLGEHNVEIMENVLNKSKEEIEALGKRGIF